MKANEIILRLVLLVGGAFAVFTGADFAGGGLKGLGLEHPPLNLAFDDAHAFYERDSHTRFVGGVWLGVGLVFIASAIWLHALSTALLAAIALIFVGGVARFTTDHPDVLLNPGVAGALTAELIGMPILFYWVSRVRSAT